MALRSKPGAPPAQGDDGKDPGSVASLPLQPQAHKGLPLHKALPTETKRPGLGHPAGAGTQGRQVQGQGCGWGRLGTTRTPTRSPTLTPTPPRLRPGARVPRHLQSSPFCFCSNHQGAPLPPRLGTRNLGNSIPKALLTHGEGKISVQNRRSGFCKVPHLQAGRCAPISRTGPWTPGGTKEGLARSQDLDSAGGPSPHPQPRSGRGGGSTEHRVHIWAHSLPALSARLGAEPVSLPTLGDDTPAFQVLVGFQNTRARGAQLNRFQQLARVTAPNADITLLSSSGLPSGPGAGGSAPAQDFPGPGRAAAAGRGCVEARRPTGQQEHGRRCRHSHNRATRLRAHGAGAGSRC
nr:uncharacterized protein LOC123286153 [Equus asinus]